MKLIEQAERAYHEAQMFDCYKKTLDKEILEAAKRRESNILVKVLKENFAILTMVCQAEGILYRQIGVPDSIGALDVELHGWAKRFKFL